MSHSPDITSAVAGHVEQVQQPSTQASDEQRGDQRDAWRAQFADNNLESTEARVLQSEGQHLLRLIEKASPGDTRDTWTYSDLEDMVEKAQHQWESKKRLGGGKPQKLFHKLMKQFDSFSGLCEVIPTGDRYVSLVTGAVKILVKASVSHSKTIEDLSDGLDRISEAVSLVDIERKLIRSEAMQNAVAKLYIAIFVFFGDAITWYKSASVSKVINSLRNDFTEKFTSAIGKIEQLAVSIQHIAQLGSGAEIRVMRLDLEDLQNELQDTRIGLEGQLRLMAELIYWQHGQNLEQHRHTQALLADTKSSTTAPAMPTSQLSEGQRRLLTAHPETVDFLDVVSHDAVPASPGRSPSRSEAEQADDFKQTESQSKEELLKTVWLARRLNEFPMLHSNQAPATNLHDSQISFHINRWLSSMDRPVLYLECPYSKPTLLEVAAQILQVCQASHLPVVVHYPGRMISNARRDARKESCLIDAMLNLSYQIMQLRPDGCMPFSDTTKSLTALGSPEDVNVEQAAAIFKASLDLIDSNLYIVVDGFQSFWDMPQGAFRPLFSTIRASLSHGHTGLKLIILSHFRLHKLLPFLDKEEIAVVHSTPQKRVPMSPISNAMAL